MAASRETSPPGFDIRAPFRTAAKSLENPHFRLYWITNALFFFGQGLTLLGAQWLMLSLTDSRSLLGALGTIQGGAVLLLSPFGGALADRWSRRNILIAARSLSAAITVTMAVLVITNQVQIWHLLLSLVGSGTVLAFSQASTQSYVFDIVGRERLTNAIALNTLATGVFQVAGPSIAGPLLATVGPQGTYLAGGAGFILGAIVLVLIPVLGKSAQQGPRRNILSSTARNFSEGVAFIRKDATLVWLFAVSMMAFFGGGILALRPVFAKEILDVGARGLGWLATCSGAGALFGGIILAGMGGRVRLMGLAVVLGQMNWMLWQMLYSQSHWYALSLGLEVIMGMSIPFASALTIAIVQMRVPEMMRNRVLAVYFMLITLLTGSGWVVGRLADSFGDREAVLLFGAIGTAFDVIVLLFGRKLILLGTAKYPLTVAGSPKAS